MSDHHYFASCAFGWATAPSRDEAIKKMVGEFRSDVKRITQAVQKRGDGPGFYLWSCKVLAPSDAQYSIEWYAPKGIEIQDAQESYVTHITAKDLAYWTAEGQQ